MTSSRQTTVKQKEGDEGKLGTKSGIRTAVKHTEGKIKPL